MPEYDFVYAKGEGKAALKLQTQNVAGKLAAGSLFTGKMGQINIWKMSADLEWGIPFTERPAALEGYACYKPQAIDIAQDPYADRKGQTDNAHVFVLLTDWEKPFVVSPPESLVDFEKDPAIIGYGKVVFEDYSLTLKYFHPMTGRTKAIRQAMVQKMDTGPKL